MLLPAPVQVMSDSGMKKTNIFQTKFVPKASTTMDKERMA